MSAAKLLTAPSLIVVNRDEVFPATNVIEGTMRSDVLLNLPGKPQYKQCVGIEDVPRWPLTKKTHGKTAIPEGTYPLEFRYSPKFSGWFFTHDGINLLTKKEYEALPKWQRKEYRQHDLIYLRNIPGFDLVLIHWGNTALDTEGCLPVGRLRGYLGKQPAILDSRVAYVALYALVAPRIRAAIERGERETIKYLDAFPPSDYVGGPEAVA